MAALPLLLLDFASPGCTSVEPARWNPPPASSSLVAGCGLVVAPSSETDYWQKTHYGFRKHNGPALTVELTGDFVATTRVRSNPAHQYDQGGLIASFGEGAWIKTSCEFIPTGPSKLGVVVTRGGYSDWSTQPAPLSPDGALEFELRLARLGAAYLVHARRSEAEAWTLLRLAHLDPDAATEPCHVGLYACCPLGEGGTCTFAFLHVRRPAEGEVALH